MPETATPVPPARGPIRVNCRMQPMKVRWSSLIAQRIGVLDAGLQCPLLAEAVEKVACKRMARNLLPTGWLHASSTRKGPAKEPKTLS